MDGPDGKTIRLLSDELRANAEALAGKVYKLDLSAPRLSFLLGDVRNDEMTNGPVMVTAAHEAVRDVLNGIRAELGLLEFPSLHSVHTTLCKVTGVDGDHAAFRARLVGWPQDGRFPKKLDSLIEVLNMTPSLVSPQLDEDVGLPSMCHIEVINTALRVASKVATEGVGEKQPAKGFMMIIGDGVKLGTAGVIGNCPAATFNRFSGKDINIAQVDTDGQAQRYVYPVFTTDGAIVIDGETGRLIASNFTVTANLTNGSQKGGKKHAAASAAAQAGCFVIKCSEDSCSVDGHAHGPLGIFNGTKEADKVQLKVPKGMRTELSTAAEMRRSATPALPNLICGSLWRAIVLRNL